MKQILWTFLLLSACTTAPKRDEPETEPSVVTEIPLEDRLGLRRPIEELGFVEKPWSNQYVSVIHFQLLCRDSEGTVSSAPINLTPLTAGQVRWQLAGQQGDTRTDENGYGQFTVVSTRSTKGQRLILRIGKQFMGFTVSEVSKVILPQNFCADSYGLRASPPSSVATNLRLGTK